MGSSSLSLAYILEPNEDEQDSAAASYQQQPDAFHPQETTASYRGSHSSDSKHHTTGRSSSSSSSSHHHHNHHHHHSSHHQSSSSSKSKSGKKSSRSAAVTTDPASVDDFGGLGHASASYAMDQHGNYIAVPDTGYADGGYYDHPGDRNPYHYGLAPEQPYHGYGSMAETGVMPHTEAAMAGGYGTTAMAVPDYGHLQGMDPGHAGMVPATSQQPLAAPHADENVRITPVTGRISRAKKGQPVHMCEICVPPRPYSRAEHLRRHQLGHGKPNFHCRYPGCNGAFYRSDLLARHEAKHAENEKAHKTSGDDGKKPGSSGRRGSAPPVDPNAGSRAASGSVRSYSYFLLLSESTSRDSNTMNLVLRLARGK
ncbi:Zinc finger, C2H2-type/integrase, DNA-binding protein [Niveomyces insectorum RCEF 264]|uniref:Zinc finger, C2H2-type/integrase, DNA-binding protein n=1 Tax=Niveomyces insectorum RCEF 264 TaxID=1081102 RepID=A0A167YWQ9_9HYPO|nr:Zinc finger, C2H2-type/integrase, DNA-binding protein [Niveomyces insectorum RCEF 264]